MAQIESADRKHIYLPSLEGIRGYAFLVVFWAHYSSFDTPDFHIKPWLVPLELIARNAWIVIPIFFVLSGYLIGGILYDTRDREGYFRVFYSRRFLRVFPIYYITLLLIAAFDIFQGIPLNFSFWSHFLYIQNLIPGYPASLTVPVQSQTGHLWSLAIEEQFYLLWPLVVWLCPNRRALLRATMLLIGLCCIMRFSAYWIHIPLDACYLWTPTRIDAILLGVLLAIIRHDRIYKRLEPFAKYAALAGVIEMSIFAFNPHLRAPGTYLSAAFEIPFVNLTAAAIIVAVLEEGSFLCRVCSMRWICWLGSMSYGLYIFHYPYNDWFYGPFAGFLAHFMPARLVFLVSISSAFCVTLLLAILSYRFIEGPAMKMRKRILYGPVLNRRSLQEAVEPIFARTDS